MAWCSAGDKPLSEPMLTQSIDAYYAPLGGDELARPYIERGSSFPYKYGLVTWGKVVSITVTS